MRIVAFAGSNSRKSINLKLVKHTLKEFEGAEINLLDLNDYEVAIYSIDRQTQYGYPSRIHDFRVQLEIADCIVLSLAEHNRSYSVAFKNIFDWSSRVDMNVFRNKPMLLMSTSPSDFGGGNVMNAAKSFFPRCGANIIETFSLPTFNDNFNEEQGIINPQLKSEFEAKINAFKGKVGFPIRVHS